MSILHKDICSCPMRYAGTEDEVCGVTFQPDKEYYVYATENRLTGSVTAYISPRGIIDVLGWHGPEYHSHVVIPYADIDIFYKIWKHIF